MLKYTFGMELELLVRPKGIVLSALDRSRGCEDSYEAHQDEWEKRHNNNRMEIMSIICDVLAQVEVEASVNLGDKDAEEHDKDYSVWNIEHDPSIDEKVLDPSTGLLRFSPFCKCSISQEVLLQSTYKLLDDVELISPILRSHEDEGEDHFSWIMEMVWAIVAQGL